MLDLALSCCDDTTPLLTNEPSRSSADGKAHSLGAAAAISESYDQPSADLALRNPLRAFRDVAAVEATPLGVIS